MSHSSKGQWGKRGRLCDWLNCCSAQLTARFTPPPYFFFPETYRAPIREHYSNIFWRHWHTAVITVVPCHFAYYANSSAKWSIHKSNKPPLAGCVELAGSVHMDQTWVNIITARRSSLEWSGVDFFFSSTLVALIQRSPLCIPPTPTILLLPSASPVMRHRGQKESKHSAAHKNTCAKI